MLVCNYATALYLISACITLNICVLFDHDILIVCILLEYIIVNVILGYILNTLIRLILTIAQIGWR